MSDQPNSEKKISVFIVDDDKFLLDMYALKFGEKNFEVNTCLSSKEALSKLAEGFTPDIMLLDMVMPNMDGFTLLAAIKEKKLAPSATFVILSNLGQKEDIERGLKLGADGYIIKASSTPSEVVEKVLAVRREKNGGK